MAGYNIREYVTLIKIISEADPKGFEHVKKLLQELHKAGHDLGSKMEAVSRFIRGAWGVSSQDVAKALKAQEEQLKQTTAESRRLEQEQRRLADAEREVTTEAQQQGGALSGLLGILRDIAVVAGGILLRDIIVGSIHKVGELVGTLRDMAVGFAEGVKDINAQMEFYQAQLVALLGGSQEAAQAIDYVRRMAIITPLYGVAELTEAIRLMTAFGLNYQRWMPVIAGTAAATASSIQQIANAFGMIASGATSRGLYYLKIAGINVRAAGIEFDKSGQAIGSVQDILEKLAAYLTERYGTLMPTMAQTWRGSIEAMRDMWYQFRWQLGLPAFEIVRDKLAQFQTWLSTNQDNILAFAYVLGEYPARALQRFLDFLGEVTGQIDMQAADFFTGAVNLMVSFADGLLTALDSYVLPAVVGIADLVASFLLGASPPERGPLSRVYEGAVSVMRTYLLGLQEGVDYQTLSSIAGFIQSALSHVWTMEDLPEEQLYPAIIRARLLVARAISEMRNLGGVSPAITAELRGMLGPIYEDVQTYLGLVGDLQIATDALTAAQYRLAEAQAAVAAAQERVAAAQAWVQEATERVQEAQDRLRRFELETAEIPERFTRGRRRELELAVQEAEEERRRRQQAVQAAQEQLKAAQAGVAAAQAQVKAAQENVRAIQEQISLQKSLLSELQRIWKLQEQQRKAEQQAQEEGDQAFTDTKVALSEVGKKLDELKEKWRAWFAEEIDPILRRLEDHWTRLGDFVRGFMGMELPGVEYDYPQIPEAYQEGARFRQALETIMENLDNIPTRIREIMEEAKKVVLFMGGVWLVLKGFQLAEGLVITAALAKALGISAAGVIATATGLLIPISIALVVTGLAISGTLPEPIKNVLYMLFPNLEVAAVTLGTDTGNSIVQAIVDHISGGAEDTEEAAHEGFVKPILDKAHELWDALVGRSIFPDMTREIINLFRRLPWQLYPHLLSLYNTITTWMEASARNWRLEIASMISWANNLILILERLIAVLLRVSSAMGGLPMSGTSTGSSGGATSSGRHLPLHGGGVVLRTGDYPLLAGERVLNREQAGLGGLGLSGDLLGGSYTFIHNWPEGIEKMDQRRLKKLVENMTFTAVKKLMEESGRD